MNKKFMSPRPKRSKVRKNRKRKSRFSGSKKIDKSYNFTFHPEQQYMVASNTAVATVDVKGGPFPLIQGEITSPSPSISGFANYYDYGFATYFRLTDLQKYSSWTSLFDNFKINYIICNIELMANSVVVNGTGVMPTLYYYVDQDDAAAPGNIGAVAGRQGAKKMTFTSSKTSYSIRIKPKYAIMTDTTTTPGINSNLQGSNGWMDCAQPDSTFYGLKVWVTDFLAAGSTVNNGFRVTWTYNVSFKGPISEF